MVTVTDDSPISWIPTAMSAASSPDSVNANSGKLSRTLSTVSPGIVGAVLASSALLSFSCEVGSENGMQEARTTERAHGSVARKNIFTATALLQQGVTALRIPNSGSARSRLSRAGGTAHVQPADVHGEFR